MQVETLQAARRDVHGTRAVRRLRKTGSIPAIVYGHGQAPEPISVDRHAVEMLLAHGAHVVNVDVNGTASSCLLKEVQYDHLGAQPVHVDFARIDLNERVRVRVPLELRGHARGVAEGGTLNQQIVDLEVECLVANIPDSIRVNVAALGLNQSLHVRELELPQGIEAIPDGDLIVVSCREILHVAEPTPAVEGAEAAAAAEPEVIAKGKVEKEGEEEPKEKEKK